MNNLICVKAKKSDAESIVNLFTESGSNPYKWNISKWEKYYRMYPEGKPTSFVVKKKDVVIGHYGILPVKINNIHGYLGVHAYVSINSRGLEVIKMLLEKIDELISENKFIVGFANNNFAQVLKRFFGWDILGYLTFSNEVGFDEKWRENKNCFVYSSAWYKWKFGEKRNYFNQQYVKDGKKYNQLLKTFPTTKTFFEKINCWNPSKSTETNHKIWSQPIAIKGSPSLSRNISDWYIEMGDSDTFEYQNKMINVS